VTCTSTAALLGLVAVAAFGFGPVPEVVSMSKSVCAGPARTGYGSGEVISGRDASFGGLVRVLFGRAVLTAGLIPVAVTMTVGSSAARTVSGSGRSTLTYLYGVSCTSRASCTAAGYSNTAPPTTTSLAERWNGKKWVIQRTPNPRGIVYIYGTSCSSARACTAVGYAETPDTTPLAERWNGTKWVIHRVPLSYPHYGSILYGVSCTSSTACTAVGISGSPKTGQTPTSLAVRWNGAKWTVERTPNRSTPTGGTHLSGVSCVSRTACTAVGYVGDSGFQEGNVALAMTWNGSKWAIKPAPDPADTNNTNLNAVSCVSRTACTAVGYAANSNGVGTISLAERWNGTTWVIQATPNPAGLGQETTLTGVSCTSRTACTAVGDSYDPVTGATASLAEFWNGTTWVIQPTVNPSGNQVDFYGVSCSAPAACTAVGRTFRGAVTGWTSLAERWDGTKWTRQPTPNPVAR
jgi:hypothetical protein